MNLITTSLMNAILRSKRRSLRGAQDERLRRAGYPDGEPLPRVRHHWTNR